MNRARQFLRNLWFYRKPYLAVMSGVMISTAVLTGALIVGDSVRFSLQRLTDIRLGKIKYAMQPDERFFRQDLAREISSQTQIQVAPVIQCGAIAINSDQNLRINKVQVIGIDSRFPGFWDPALAVPGEDEAIVSRNVAEKLNLQVSGELLLRIQKAGKTPSNAPFSAEKESSVPMRFRVVGIDDLKMGRFSLKNNQTAPFNIFISLPQLASKLDLTGYANILVAGGESALHPGSPLPGRALRSSWKAEDAGLHFGSPCQSADTPTGWVSPVGVCEITTDRIFFDETTANAILSAIPGCEAILTYLVNSVSTADRSAPYSFVTAANETFLKQAIGPGEIIINEWLATDLHIGPGDSVSLRYFIMGPLRTLKEDSARFCVGRVIPDKNSLADRGLMPDFPGMSEAGNCRDWETGAPVDLKRIRNKDEQYWKDFRGTPKAFISLETGRKIWNNRFGLYTAFRFSTTDSQLTVIKTRLMKKLLPEQYGLTFRAVYQDGQLAAGNSTDFGELFLSLSFFIVVSGLLLTVMLFSLLARSRQAETAILSAIGFPRRQIMKMMVAETLVVALAGAIPGTLAGILCNRLLIAGLNTIWHNAVNTSMVVMHIEFRTLVSGAGAGIALSLAVMTVVLWRNLQHPLATMVRGDSGTPDPASGKRNRLISSIAGIVSITSSILLVTGLLVTGQIMNAPLFLASGALFLIGGPAMVNLFLIRKTDKTDMNPAGFFRLVIKNAGLNRHQTLAVITLLSLGLFSILITGANRKTFYGTEMNRSSGTGGFLLWGETVLPIMNDLNTPEGVKAYGLQDEELLRQVRFVQMTRLDGDDASCLNLNQVSRPAMLGVPNGWFDRVHAFSFKNLAPSVGKEHPWKYLGKRLAPDMVPGFADETVITWGLRKKLGDTLLYRDESGKILKIKLVGGLDNSIFQGNILVSDSLLHLFFPSSGGSHIMLTDGPVKDAGAIAGKLEALFRDQGMMITSTPARLAAFNEVENTYLSVFMMLGGLGVIIGTFGLGIVILRNIRQRKQEFATYLVLGFGKRFILRMIMAEHIFMLLAGLLVGVLSAFMAMLPSLVSPGYAVPGVFISSLILLVLTNSLLWIWLPARKAVNHKLLSGLREE